jgi:hypothetical protein
MKRSLDEVNADNPSPLDDTEHKQAKIKEEHETDQAANQVKVIGLSHYQTSFSSSANEFVKRPKLAMVE